MPSQSVEAAEMIAALKRAIKRSEQAPSDDQITAPSNRGNKLKKGASHVKEGALIYSSGPGSYRQKIEHAGYSRDILERKPRRYNEVGDELEHSESDEEADADAAEENAYSGVLLEDLLCPLKHPSELGVHPSLSEPYLSPALPDMIKTTEEKLRQEKANLWRAKNVSRQVLGDMAWLPCGAIESQDDSNLFEPARRRADASRAKKRKLGRDSIPVDAAAIDMTATETATTHDQEGAGVPQTESDARMTNGTADTARHNENREHEHATKEEAESMQRRARLAATEVGRDAETHDQATTMNHETGASLLKGKGSADVDQDRQRLIDGLTQGENEEVRQPPGQEPDTEEVKKLAERENEEGQETPPPPPRRVTRALAATNGSNPESANITPPDSPTSIASEGSSSSLLQIDPLYLLPNELHPSFSSVVIPGVPLDEFMDIRRLLTTYIQKQEESVRGYESVLSKLRKAYRLRKSVLKMCKAEGHVGEVSDGEDWIDLDYWGLKQGDLKKGKDEDEDAVEEATIGGRKGKRRARN